MIPRPTPRAALVALAVLVTLLASATPAAADAPRPTDYRSTVTDVAPALPAGAEVRVVGGDSLLELSLPAGHTAVVPDYTTASDAEPVPYLRFDADGTVRRNTRAVATSANEARYGTTSTDPDPDAEPAWEIVATDGTYAWHDHRIHWMSPRAPRTLDDRGRVDLGGPEGRWIVPLTVDGHETTVTGELVLVPAPPVGAWIVVAIASIVVVVVCGLRFGLRPSAALGATAAAGATVVAVATWRAVPPAAGASAVPVVVAAVSLLGGLLGAAGPRRIRLVAVAATAAGLIGWGTTRWTVLTRAVLPTTLDPWMDRAATAVAIGVGLGLAGLLLRGPMPGHRHPPRA